MKSATQILEQANNRNVKSAFTQSYSERLQIDYDFIKKHKGNLLSMSEELALQKWTEESLIKRICEVSSNYDDRKYLYELVRFKIATNDAERKLEREARTLENNALKTQKFERSVQSI